MEEIRLNLGGDTARVPQETQVNAVNRASSQYASQPHIQRILSRVHEGVSIHNYRIRGPIGIGSHGVVYQAQDQEDGCDVALKVFNLPEASISEGNFANFRSIIADLSKIQHPALMTVFEARSWQSLHMMSMELFLGPLGTPLDLLGYSKYFDSVVDQAVMRKIFLHLLDAVRCVHEHGIIHCNLKPSNILFKYIGNPEDDSGVWRVELKLTDFGVAQLIGESRYLSELKSRQSAKDHAADTLALQQTIDYLSPQQLQGGPATIQTDIYSMGRILCMLLTGARNPQLPPSEIRDGLHPAWDAVIARATSSSPDEQFKDAHEMAHAIHDIALDPSV